MRGDEPPCSGSPAQGLGSRRPSHLGLLGHLLERKAGFLKLISLCLAILALTFHFLALMYMVIGSSPSPSLSPEVDMDYWEDRDLFAPLRTLTGVESVPWWLPTALFAVAFILIISAWMFSLGKVAEAMVVHSPFSFHFRNYDFFRFEALGHLGHAFSLVVAALLDAFVFVYAPQIACLMPLWAIISTIVFVVGQALVCFIITCVEKKELQRVTGTSDDDMSEQSNIHFIEPCHV